MDWQIFSWPFLEYHLSNRHKSPANLSDLHSFLNGKMFKPIIEWKQSLITPWLLKTHLSSSGCIGLFKLQKDRAMPAYSCLCPHYILIGQCLTYMTIFVNEWMEQWIMMKEKFADLQRFFFSCFLKFFQFHTSVLWPPFNL